MRSSNKAYGIITTDGELVITSWNEWMEIVSGKLANQVVGQKMTDVIPDMDSRGLTPRFLKALNESTVEVLSSVFHKYLIKCEISASGEAPSIMKQHVTIGPLKSDRSVLGLIITVEDASDFKLLDNTNEQDDENIHQLENGDWRVRKSAQLKLTKEANHSTLVSLFNLLKDKHHDIGILSSILLVLSQSETDVIGDLLSLLEENDTDLRIYVIQALGDRNDPRAIPTLIQCLNDIDANVRYHAIEALGKLEAHEATEQLVSIALSGDFFTAFPAIDALTSLGESSVVSKVMPLIDNPMFCDAIINLLGKLGDVEVVEFLTSRINQSGYLMVAITGALQEINTRYELMFRESELIKDVFSTHINSSGIHNLIKATECTDADEIHAIIKVLGWVPTSEAQKALTHMLGNPSLQKEVIEAFVNYGNKVTDLLIDQLNATDSETRNAAAIALGRIGDPKSGPALINMISEDDELAVFVIGSLAKLGIREAFEPLLAQLGAQNPSVRRASIAALNSVGHPDMPNCIENLIQSEDPLFRESAIHVAGYFGYPNCKKLVQQCLEDPDNRVVCAAIENLPFFEDYSTIEILSGLYTQGSTQIRSSVVKASLHIDDVRQFEILAESLYDQDAWVRYYSIRTISIRYLIEYLPNLIHLIQNDKAIHVRLAAIEAIGKMNGTEAIPVLSELLHEENNDIVLTTITALGMLQSEMVLTLLLPMIDDLDIQKKCTVIAAVSHYNAPDVIEKLYWIAATETNQLVTNAAIEGLSTIKSVQAIDYLIQLANISKIKETCISFLILNNVQSVTHLIKTFDDHSLQIKRTIIEFLARIKNTEASDALIQLLNHKIAQIRIDAMRALYRIGNVNVREKVEYISQKDPDLVARYNAREILKKS